VAAEAGEITAAQIYAMEYVIKRELKGAGTKTVLAPVQEVIEESEDKIKVGRVSQKRAGKYILRVYPHRSRSKKPNETGLGRGKGAIDR
jgi:ribosomal protein L16/L10AE